MIQRRYKDFEELNDGSKRIIVQIINRIIYEIRKNNIDIYKLSENLYLSVEEFIDYLRNPKSRYSEYLEFIREIDILLGRC